MVLLKLTDRHSPDRLENACSLTLSYTSSPSYKSVKDFLADGRDKVLLEEQDKAPESNPYALTCGLDYDWRWAQ